VKWPRGACRPAAAQRAATCPTCAASLPLHAHLCPKMLHLALPVPHCWHLKQRLSPRTGDPLVLLAPPQGRGPAGIEEAELCHATMAPRDRRHHRREHHGALGRAPAGARRADALAAPRARRAPGRRRRRDGRAGGLAGRPCGARCPAGSPASGAQLHELLSELRFCLKRLVPVQRDVLMFSQACSRAHQSPASPLACVSLRVSVRGGRSGAPAARRSWRLMLW